MLTKKDTLTGVFFLWISDGVPIRVPNGDEIDVFIDCGEGLRTVVPRFIEVLDFDNPFVFSKSGKDATNVRVVGKPIRLSIIPLIRFVSP